MTNSSKSVLIQKARDYLKECSEKRALREVAQGCGISIDWVYKFHQGRIESPSVNFIEKILIFGGFEIQVLKSQASGEKD
ncbi:MAG: transcriptional regulator with XRE-family HTH domain [Pseudoalteromonas distincta]|jgi:transcriptional regulator with XRE-family HTH domain